MAGWLRLDLCLTIEMLAFFSLRDACLEENDDTTDTHSSLIYPNGISIFVPSGP
jgi:hypothetical protein